MISAMIFKIGISILLIKVAVIVAVGTHLKEKDSEVPNYMIELTDEKWDQIQKGQWLVGFFDKETEESRQLEKSWQVIANSCKASNINVGRVFAPQNPGLYVRFLVTVFPKVFYVKNGVAHEIPKVSEESLSELISNQKWSKLKPVNFLSNPFSVQMSLLSHLFVHAVNLYNFENAIVQKFVSAPSATDVVFGLTFIVVGTFLGLLMTCAFGILQILLMDSKESEEKSDDQQKEEKDDEDEIKNLGYMEIYMQLSTERMFILLLQNLAFMNLDFMEYMELNTKRMFILLLQNLAFMEKESNNKTSTARKRK